MRDARHPQSCGSYSVYERRPEEASPQWPLATLTSGKGAKLPASSVFTRGTGGKSVCLRGHLPKKEGACGLPCSQPGARLGGGGPVSLSSGPATSRESLSAGGCGRHGEARPGMLAGRPADSSREQGDSAQARATP